MVCDPSLERCSDTEAILRPNSDDLTMLGLQYFVELFSVPLIYSIVFAITGNNLDYFKDARDYVTILSWTVWLFPFTFVFLYLTFGSDFILFRLVDDVTIFMIQYWVSNVAFIAHWSAISAIFSAVVAVDYDFENVDYYWNGNITYDNCA